MKNYLLLGGLIGTLMFISACGDDDPLPPPMASFNQDARFIEPGQSVTFTSTSMNAATVEWDFGDGQTSMETNPTVTFTSVGEFLVMLTAITADNQMATATDTVTVGERIMGGFSIDALNFSKGDTTTWDPSTNNPDGSGPGPDIALIMGSDAVLAGGGADLAGFVGADIASADLPLALGIQGDDLVLTDESWTLILLDDDSPNLDGSGTNELMVGFQFNPTAAGLIDEDNGTGFFVLNSAGFGVTIFFDIGVPNN